MYAIGGSQPGLADDAGVLGATLAIDTNRTRRNRVRSASTNAANTGTVRAATETKRPCARIAAAEACHTGKSAAAKALHAVGVVAGRAAPSDALDAGAARLSGGGSTALAKNSDTAIWPAKPCDARTAAVRAEPALTQHAGACGRIDIDRARSGVAANA